MVKLIRKATLEDVPQLVSLAIQMWKSHTVEDLTKIFCEHIRKGKNMGIFSKYEYKKIELPFYYIREKEDIEAGGFSIEAYGEINGTITASAQPENCGVTHPVENRRYSVRECARIQSFPDNFYFGNIPLQSRYKVIGNAVPPVLGWVVAKALLNHLN